MPHREPVGAVRPPRDDPLTAALAPDRELPRDGTHPGPAGLAGSGETQLADRGEEEPAVPVVRGHLQVEPGAHGGGSHVRRETQGLADRLGPLRVQPFQDVQQPGTRVRVRQDVVETGGALVRGLQQAREPPRLLPPGTAAPIQGVVEAGQERAGQVVLFGGQFTPVGQRRGHDGRTGARFDTPDERLEVGAVDGRVVEVARGAVSMGVEPSPAGPHDGAPAARLADPGQAELPGPDAGMGGDVVEGVVEHVESGGGRTLVGALEGVDLLQLPVRLDDHQIRGGESEGLRETGAAAQRREHRGEQAYRHGTALLLPAVEHREQPVRVGRGRSVGTGRRIVPCGVREEEVDERGVERDEGVQHGVRIVLDVDRAQEPQVEVAVAVLPEQLDRLEHEGVTAAPVGETPVPVVGRAVAVEGDAHPDAELVEEVQVPGAELKAVGVDPEVEVGHTGERGAELLADPAKAGGARQQRLPSVQDH